ncbi:hypothetical protein SPH72_04645 [Rhodobacterales bacterium FZCC0083]|nr:hypothetical protein SPH72_04645 [Rhodobacterales bacterium FZCC0083]
MSNRAALLIAIVTCTNPAIAQEFDDEPEIELNDHGLNWNIGGTTVEVSGNASLSFSYANGETTNSSELAATLGISREFANTVMLGAEFGVSSESFLKHNPEGGAESSKPIDIVVYSETQFGTLSYGDVGNSLDKLVSNVGDGADLDASADILFVGNFDRFSFAASYEVNGMNDYVIAATYDADPLTIGVGYGAADDIGYYTISAGTDLRDLSIVTSYTGNENGKSSYGAKLGYSISEIDLGATYSFYEEKHSYGLSAAYQLDIGPVVQVGWSTSDGIGAGLSFEF